MKYLLDSNVLIEAIRRPESQVGRRLNATPLEDLATSAVVAGELLVGPFRQKSRSRESVLDILSIFLAMEVLPFTLQCARIYGEIAALLVDQGTPIGDFDAQIAATALVHDLTVATHNTRHFHRVPGLRVEDWQTDVGPSP